MNSDVREFIHKDTKRNKWVYGEEFINWLKVNSINYCSVKDLSDKTKINYHLVSKLNKQYQLEFIPSKNDINFKAIYQDYDWCYQKFMVEGLNHEEMAVETSATKRTIEKWCTEKHRLTQKLRQENKVLNELQKYLIIGSLLGDGHIDKRETQPLFIVSHAKNQKDYLYFKYEILKDICNSPPSITKGGIHFFTDNPKGYLAQDSYRISTRIQDDLLKYRGMNNIELLNNLNEFSLAIWVLDDGYRGQSNWQICVADFTQEEKEYTVKHLMTEFDLECYITNSDDRYINFRATSTRVLDKMILENIPNELDIIQYKIINNDKICNAQHRVYIKSDGEDILLTDYCKDNNLEYKHTWHLHKDELKVVANE